MIPVYEYVVLLFQELLDKASVVVMMEIDSFGWENWVR